MQPSILDKAKELVHSSRPAMYGSPERNLTDIGKLWGIVLKCDPIPPRTVALMMICVKIARDTKVPQDDNLIDIAGYAEAGFLSDPKNTLNQKSVPTSKEIVQGQCEIPVLCGRCSIILNDNGMYRFGTHVLCQQCYEEMSK